MQRSIGILIILGMMMTMLFSPNFSTTVELRNMVFEQSSSSPPYMSLFNFSSVSGLTSIPFVLYPVNNKTVWVDAVRFGQRFLSLLVNYTIGGTPQVVLNTTESLSDIVADRQGRVWMAGNDLSYYDTMTKRAYNLTTFQGSEPQFMAIDNSNRLWVTLLGTNSIGMANLLTGQNATYPLPTPKAFPQGITVASDGTVWVVELGVRKIARLDPNNSSITEYSSPLKLIAPYHVTVDNAGIVWFTDHGSNEFGSFNPKTGEWKKYPIGYCPGLGCSIGLPNEMFVGQNGNVWFSEHLPGRIAEYDPVSDVLTEYVIPVPSGTSGQGFAYSWWASPGPNGLVWFTAFGYNEIGYVNSTVPVNFNIRTENEISVERGLTTQLAVTINHQSQGMVSLGVNPSSLDTSGGQPSITGSFIQNVLVGTGVVTATIGLTVTWNAQNGSHTVMVTASDGQVAVSVPVRVNVVEPFLIYLGIAGATSAIAAAAVLYLRRRRRRRVSLSNSGSPQREAPSPSSESIPENSSHFYSIL